MNGTSLLQEPAGGGRPDPAGDCEVFEPAIAALADGALGERERERLARHLAGCAACREVTGRVTLFRAELDAIPEPRAPRPAPAPRLAPVVSASDPVPPGVPASVAAGGATGSPLGARLLGAFVAPRGFRLVWALELALVAIGAALMASAPVGRPAVHREDLAAIERRAHLAEERAEAAERRAESAEALAGSAVSLAARVEALEERYEPSRREPPEAPERPPARPAGSAPKGTEPPAVAPGAAAAPVVNEAPSAVQQEPRAPGMLTVVCAPFCDEVLDGTRTLGPSPIVRVPVAPGRHLLTLKKAGVADKKLAVEVVSGQVAALRVMMK